MSKKLAIKGHSTRGKEVIELLKMMGGINDEGYIGTNTWKDEYYFLDNGYIRAYDWCDGIKFTLEEFLEIYPFKIGDEVETLSGNCGKVCAMKWEYDEIKYQLDFGNLTIKGWYTTSELLKYNDNTNEPSKNMEEKDKAKAPDLKGEDYSGKRFGYKIPNGYEFDMICNGEIILKPIKPKYPDNYDECVRIAKNIHGYDIHIDAPAYSELLESFVKLLICRDAYWKIVGEEMGLGKPWDSTYGCGEWGYWIGYSINENKIYLQDSRILVNHTLVFPTKEMCDAFYENFKDLIEQCKELL